MRRIILLIVMAFLSFNIQAQMSLTPSPSATTMAQMLAGSGVTVMNATNNCSDSAKALFTYTPNSVFGLDSGIVLTTGTAANYQSATTLNAYGVATGLATSPGGPFSASPIFASYDSNPPINSDPDLLVLSNAFSIHDACYIEFDFIPTGDTIQFEYVFGSEEYPSFNCSINDVFGFFISGPGITGPYTGAAANIALIPGTTLPVAISTINNGSGAFPGNSCYTNTGGLGPFTNLYVSNYDSFMVGIQTGLTYTGYSKTLTALAVVQPCSTYHMKLGVADGSDWIYDTGVFLKAGSLSSNEYTYAGVTGLTDGSNPYVVEGCDTARVFIKRKIAVGTTPIADTVHLIIGGNAINGVDFPYIDSLVYFSASASDTLQTLVIAPFADGLYEPGPNYETVKIYITGGCGSTITDSIVFQIRDSLFYTLTNNNVSICQGTTVPITGTFDPLISFQWSPPTGVTNPNILLTSITPPNVGVQTYTVSGSYLTCPDVTKSFTITTDPTPTITAIPDFDICQGQTQTINAQVNPPFNYMINWTPSGGMSNPGSMNTTFSGLNTSTYTLTLVSPNAGCTDNEITTINVWPYTTGTIRPDTIVCGGESVQLWATNTLGTQFLWWPSSTLSCSTCPDPIATALGTTIYNVALIEPHGCNDTLDVMVESHPPFQLQLFNGDTTIYYGDTVHMNATGAPFIFWTPTDYLSFSTSGDPAAYPLVDSITYYVTGVSTLGGCPQTDSITIRVQLQDVYIPNAFSPNGDGKNDVFKPWARKLIKTHAFMVYDRWGKEVFTSKSIYDGWNGTSYGKRCDPGVYMYFMKFEYPDGRVVTHKGDVTLLR